VLRLIVVEIRCKLFAILSKGDDRRSKFLVQETRTRILVQEIGPCVISSRPSFSYEKLGPSAIGLSTVLGAVCKRVRLVSAGHARHWPVLAVCNLIRSLAFVHVDVRNQCHHDLSLSLLPTSRMLLLLLLLMMMMMKTMTPLLRH